MTSNLSKARTKTMVCLHDPGQSNVDRYKVTYLLFDATIQCGSWPHGHGNKVAVLNRNLAYTHNQLKTKYLASTKITDCFFK